MCVCGLLVGNVISVLCSCCLVFFFFKQKTAYEMRISDWSSDVCSSDLTMSSIHDSAARAEAAAKAILQVKDLSVAYNTDDGVAEVLDGVSLSVGRDRKSVV